MKIILNKNFEHTKNAYRTRGWKVGGVMKLSGVGVMELTQVECATSSTSLVQSHVKRDGVLVHQRG